MRVPVFTISTARQKFFALFKAVTAHPGLKIIIRNRSTKNLAVLVCEAYFKELETTAKRLRSLAGGTATRAQDFRLIGSGRIADGTDDPMAKRSSPKCRTGHPRTLGNTPGKR